MKHKLKWIVQKSTVKNNRICIKLYYFVFSKLTDLWKIELSSNNLSLCSSVKTTNTTVWRFFPRLSLFLGFYFQLHQKRWIQTGERKRNPFCLNWAPVFIGTLLALLSYTARCTANQSVSFIIICFYRELKHWCGRFTLANFAVRFSAAAGKNRSCKLPTIFAVIVAW